MKHTGGWHICIKSWKDQSMPVENIYMAATSNSHEILAIVSHTYPLA